MQFNYNLFISLAPEGGTLGPVSKTRRGGMKALGSPSLHPSSLSYLTPIILDERTKRSVESGPFVGDRIRSGKGERGWLRPA